jgi:hypothetical protein
MRRLQQQRRRQEASQQQVLSPQKKRVALAVYVLSGHSRQVAAEFVLQSSSKKVKCSHVDPATLVEQYFLGASIAEIVAADLPETCAENKVVTEAKKWLARHKTAAWVCNMNYEGVAPGREQLIAQCSQHVPAECAAALSSSSRTERRFCTKLRRDFHLRLGALKVQDPISDADIANKAAAKL